MEKQNAIQKKIGGLLINLSASIVAMGITVGVFLLVMPSLAHVFASHGWPIPFVLLTPVIVILGVFGIGDMCAMATHSVLTLLFKGKNRGVRE